MLSNSAAIAPPVAVADTDPTSNAATDLDVANGDPAGCTDPNGLALPRDQRGANRSGVCDLGAYECDGVPREWIFSDGFESGTTYLWAATP